MNRDAIIGAVGTVLVGLAFLILPLGEGLAELSYDLPYFFRKDVKPEGVTIVYMDWDSHARLGQDQFRRWDRALHARLIDRLKELGACVIVFDVVFLTDTNSPAADRELVRAAREHGRVAVGGLVAPDLHQGSVIGWKLTKPFPALEAVTAWGVVEAGDENRSVRQHYYRRDYDAPSLAWRASELAGSTKSLDPFRERWVNYYGPPGLIPHHIYWEVLETNAVSSADFSNKVVFVGALYDVGMTGGKGTDDFRTPYTRWTGRRSPGVEVLATTYLNLARGDALNRLPPVWEALAVALVGALAGVFLVRCRPGGAALWTAVGFLLVAAGSIFVTWRWLVWFPWMVVGAVQLPCALAWSILSFTRRQETRRKPLPPPFELTAEEEQRIRGQLARAPFAAATPGIEPMSPANRAAISEATLAAHSGSPDGIPSIPDHQLLRRVGKGAYGEVWLARSVIGTYHAVKMVHRSTFSDAAPFEREFNGLCKFTPISRSHPGLLHILHVGRHDAAGYLYYVMEAADDESTGPKINPDTYSPKTLVKELQRRKRLPLDECLQLGVDLATALDVLHQQQLIHRDIKPANIIYVNGSPKLADIGLVTEAEGAGAVTSLGTEGYIPPEGPGTAGGDVYSLGKVLYEASAGLRVNRFPELPRELVADPREDAFLQLNAIVMKACANVPAARFKSADELRQALAKLQTKLNSGRPPKP